MLKDVQIATTATEHLDLTKKKLRQRKIKTQVLMRMTDKSYT